MESEFYYLFDPVQNKEYGGGFFQGADFYYRSQQSKKLFYKNIYIPFGPCCNTKEGFDNFLKHMQTLRFAKVTIDLPTIYNRKQSEEIIEKLKKAGYKKIPYFFQDEETLLAFKDDLKLDNKKRNIINRGQKFVDVEVKNKLSQKEIDDIYKIYLESGKRIGFSIKPKVVFEKLSEDCLVSLAVNKETKELEGYVFGTFFYCQKTDFSDKEKNKILFNMFTGTNSSGREHKIGHAMYYQLFKEAFEKHGVDMVDMRGASRTKNRSYLHFKHDFAKMFYDLPGSFRKIYL